MKQANTPRIIAVGHSIHDESVINADFSSSISFLDFDMLIWNPSTLMSEYKSDFSNPTYMGCRSLNDDDSARILDDFHRRKNEVLELLNLGRTVVLFLPSPEKCYYATGQKNYTGTGKNRIATRLVAQLDLFSAIPINDFGTIVASGENIEFRGNEPFKRYWTQTQSFHYYSAYFAKTLGQPFLFIKGTTKAIASWIPTAKGTLLVLPSINSEEDFDTRKKFRYECGKFIKAIVELVTVLQKSTGDCSLPLWAHNFMLPDEKEQRTILANEEVVLQAQLLRISRLKEQIAQKEKYKFLFTATGRALEIEIARVLKEIGFSVEPGTEGRDDLILRYGDKVAIVEIKGVAKSASEKHAAQLEKWVSEYFTTHNKRPKGLLIVNAFCDTLLSKRNDPPFPNQMLSYSINREHCLISTIQILGLYISIIKKPEDREQLITELLDTKGKYPRFLDYRDFLEEYNLDNEATDS